MLFVNGDVDVPVKLAQHLGFNTSDTDRALNFLAEATPELVTAAAADLNVLLGPCKEKSFSGVDNFVETDPFSMSNPKQIKNTPVLIGQTSHEVSWFFSDDYYKSDPFYANIKNNFNFDENDITEIVSIVRHYYIGDEAISKNLEIPLQQFESDFIFNHPTRRTITNLLKEDASPVYEYLFSYVEDKALPGAGHADELQYLFDMESKTIEDNEETQLIRNRITTLWANFVKYGNPTPTTTELLPVEWTPSSLDSRPYLIIDTDMKLGHMVFKERMSFWDLFYSVYGNRHVLSRDCAI